MNEQRLTPIDAVLLRADHPSNPLTVTGVLMFSEPLDRARLAALIEARLLTVPCFHQKAVPDPRVPGRFYWQDDPGFDLDYHLQLATLPVPGDQAALQEFVSDLASVPLDLTRPLWQFHLVEDYGPGSALICRLHHGMADGVALVRLLLSIADSPDAASPAEAQPGTVAPGPRSRLGTGMHLAGQVARGGTRSMLHPVSTWKKARSKASDLLAFGGTAAATFGTLLLYEADPETPLRGKLTGHKRAAWSALVPLSDVKLIGRRLGGTVNDVLITALTGALRLYLLDHGVDLDGTSLRALVPVNMRSDKDKSQLGNKIGIVFLSLPTSEADPTASLAAVKRGMDGLKVSLEPWVTLGLFQILGVAPRPLQDVLFSILGSKATALITNVMGPQEPIRLADAPLDSVIFWVPQSGGVGLGISILSYAGQVRLGVLVDQELVPDPEAIVAGFEAELQTLMAVAADCPEPPSVKGMLASLDHTLGTVDSILAGAGEEGRTSANQTEEVGK